MVLKPTSLNLGALTLLWMHNIDMEPLNPIDEPFGVEAFILAWIYVALMMMMPWYFEDVLQHGL